MHQADLESVKHGCGLAITEAAIFPLNRLDLEELTKRQVRLNWLAVTPAINLLPRNPIMTKRHTFGAGTGRPGATRHQTSSRDHQHHQHQHQQILLTASLATLVAIILNACHAPVTDVLTLFHGLELASPPPTGKVTAAIFWILVTGAGLHLGAKLITIAGLALLKLINRNPPHKPDHDSP